MKKILLFIIIFILGFLFAVMYYNKSEQKNEKEQIQVMLHEIKNVSKLVVAETNVSEIYNYESADKYLFETLSFDKKVIVLVNAKVQVSYDLSKMKIDLDSINKKIILKQIPKAEVFVAPDLKYYDFQQSTFNSFTKEELNKINQRSIDKIKETIQISELKNQAKKELITELKKIYNLTNILKWELVDASKNKIWLKNFKN